jgi:hypothetical protein
MTITAPNFCAIDRESLSASRSLLVRKSHPTPYRGRILPGSFGSVRVRLYAPVASPTSGETNV